MPPYFLFSGATLRQRHQGFLGISRINLIAERASSRLMQRSAGWPDTVHRHSRRTGQPSVTHPELVGVENPSGAPIVCQGETFTFKLDQALADNGGIYLVIEATEGQSNGVTRAHAKASGIELVEEPTAEAPITFIFARISLRKPLY